MKIHPAEQGTDAWKLAKCGTASSSNSHRMITKKTFAPAKTNYLDELLAESILGLPSDETKSQWMARGNEEEQKGREWYELDRDVTVTQVGFCTTDDGSFGTSPDGLVDPDGQIEIKVLSAVKHIACWRKPALLYAEFICQAQSSLWVTGRDWLDLIAFNARLEPVVVRVEPDPRFQEAFAPIVSDFAKQLAAHRERYEQLFVSNPFL